MINYSKLMAWAESVTVSDDHKWLDSSIDDVESELVVTKTHLKRLKVIQSQLKLARELGLTFLSDRLSVQCDGKAISIGWLKDQPDALERGILKRLGFRWSLDKREYQRKVSGVNAEAVREFIKECHESTEQQ